MFARFTASDFQDLESSISSAGFGTKLLEFGSSGSIGFSKLSSFFIDDLNWPANLNLNWLHRLSMYPWMKKMISKKFCKPRSFTLILKFKFTESRVPGPRNPWQGFLTFDHGKVIQNDPLKIFMWKNSIITILMTTDFPDRWFNCRRRLFDSSARFQSRH